MYKAVIFDFFDVIHRDPYNHWLKKHGIQRAGAFEESARRVDRGDISHEEHYEEVSRLSGQDSSSIREIFNDTSFVDPGVVTLIKELHGRYKTGLLSNSSGWYLRPILEEHHLPELFDEIVISADVGMIKPEAEIFDYMLGRMGVTPAETIFIDDNPRNTAAAEGLGIHGIVFTAAEALRKDLAAAGIKVS